MPLEDASQQALLQASLKDDFYLQIIRNQFTQICQQILGAKIWLSWKKELEIISDLLYFFLTTIQGSQTLGEEYAAIIQVDSSKRKISGQIQRILYVLLKCTSPYLLEKVFGKLQLRLEQSKDFSTNQKKNLVVFIKFLQKLFPVIQKLHLLLFYVNGMYADVALRASKIKHILIRPYNKNESDPSTFRWLSALLAVQSFVAFYTAITTSKQEMLETTKGSISNEEMSQPNTQLTHKIKCILCLGIVEDASSTVCGHVFCWNCIVDWCTIKPECPSCRERCPPSKVVKLHHFIPSQS